jgi:hypothetical protein
MGCHQSLSTDPFVLYCAFADGGSPFENGAWAVPCQSAYHARCLLSVGAPFQTRRKDSGGLAFPRVRHWATFVCEACSVCAIMDQELTSPTDWKLLCFERMRILDTTHHWAIRTHSKYQGKLSAMVASEDSFDIPRNDRILRPAPLLQPPVTPEIPLMWLQESYSLRPGKRTDAEPTLALFETLRQFRSAAAQYMALDALVSHPDRTCYDQKNSRVLYNACRPTDGLSFSFFADGMSARIGQDTHQSVALLDRHARFLVLDLDEKYLNARTPSLWRSLALAGLASLVFWLAWLRSSELFGLRWMDVGVVEPVDGPTLDLNRGCGAVLFRLSPETKSSRTRQADVPVAYGTLSGYHIDKWLQKKRRR